MSGYLTAVRTEWTKFRTVRGWLLAPFLAALAIAGFGLAPGMQGSCGKNGPGSQCSQALGPDREAVTNSYTVVHQALPGDGGLTVRIATLTGDLPDRDGPGTHPGLAPWAKAGLLLRADTAAGSRYAAVLLTGAHGIRMQDDYTHDVAGPAADPTAPHWLRLTRAGETITAEESADGTRWTTVGTARMPGLRGALQVGMFVTSPQYNETAHSSFGSTSSFGGPSWATAVFDHIEVTGGQAGGGWSGEVVGAFDNRLPGSKESGFHPTADGFSLTGSGDLAPAVAGVAGLGTTITATLVGTFVGLLIVVVLGALFVTAEYRRGLIRVTLAATPHRGRVLAAKATVAGAATFVAGLVAAALVVTVGQRVLRGNGVYVAPASLLTEIRVVVGTGALLALGTLLGLGLGVLLRRSATAVAAAVVATVLPYLLAVSVLPGASADWLLRTSPAAGFAVQQTATRYFQVDNFYAVTDGYFPLPIWAGFAVLCGWTALALGLGAVRLRRSDG
jgi:ABC-type transport system involved in multi-copper enzyme maturation permease subunit